MGLLIVLVRVVLYLLLCVCQQRQVKEMCLKDRAEKGGLL